MSSYKYKHLTLDDRITIQKALKEGQTFVEIGALIGKDPSTVSKEVKAHLDLFTITTELFECKHKTVAINIEEMHIICNMQIEETYIM